MQFLFRKLFLAAGAYDFPLAVFFVVAEVGFRSVDGYLHFRDVGIFLSSAEVVGEPGLYFLCDSPVDSLLLFYPSAPLDFPAQFLAQVPDVEAVKLLGGGGQGCLQVFQGRGDVVVSSKRSLFYYLVYYSVFLHVGRRGLQHLKRFRHFVRASEEDGGAAFGRYYGIFGSREHKPSVSQLYGDCAAASPEPEHRGYCFRSYGNHL